MNGICLKILWRNTTLVFIFLQNIPMRLQRNWTSAITLKVRPNDADVTLQPGNVIDVPQSEYQGMKDQYTEFIDVGNDAQQQMRVKALTSTQIKALNTTPQVLVPAPWAGYAIVVDKVVSSLSYLSAAYNTNTDLEFKYDSSTAGDAGGAEVTMASSTILTASADSVKSVSGLGQASEEALTINKWVTAKVASWNPATWAGALKIRVYYHVVSVS